MTLKLARLLLVGLLLGGCQAYTDWWADYDKDHLTCRTTPANSITGSTETVCPAPGY